MRIHTRGPIILRYCSMSCICSFCLDADTEYDKNIIPSLRFEQLFIPRLRKMDFSPSVF